MPAPVRAAVEVVTQVIPDTAAALALVHRLWFLRLAGAADVLPVEATAESVAALCVGDRAGAAVLVATWFSPCAPLAGTPAGFDALSRAAGLLSDCRATPADLGRSYEALATSGRKGAGRYYTAPGLVSVLVPRVIHRWLDARSGLRGATLTAREAVGLVADLAVCDPACGGGAFLLAALDVLTSVLVTAGVAPATARTLVLNGCLHGVDVDPGAATVTAMALWLAGGRAGESFNRVAARVPCADALGGRAVATEYDGFRARGLLPGVLTGTDWEAVFPRVFGRPSGGFDVVVGNPPWVAYAGRSTVPLEPSRRAFLRARYAGFGGFPTLHGAFLERASAWLRPGGVLGLVLPSPIADLDGYAPARTAHTAICTPVEPLEEFGQDAFPGVVQPCFALESVRREDPGEGTPARWALRERARMGAPAVVVTAPAAVHALAGHPRFPPGLFGEWGFQSGGDVVQTLIVRADAPTGAFTVPLRGGRDVGEFRVGPPRRYLSPDLVALRRARCRLRPTEDWATAVFVVRQTARHPIAALYGEPVAFRNSLLAGFAGHGWEPALLVALLNSSLLRAVHRAGQRDGRQRVFPQVKVAHLRALPAPAMRDSVQESELADLTRRWTAAGRALTGTERDELDARVCRLYAVAPSEGERAALRRFVTG